VDTIRSNPVNIFFICYTPAVFLCLLQWLSRAASR
jgi:hypothetical protein